MLYVILTGLFVATSLIVWIRAITFHPQSVQPEPATAADGAPILEAGQIIKVMTFNVQYMAGKNYVFYYDGGPDGRPSSSDISRAIAEVARIIHSEDPDIVLLQEVDDGAKRTDYEDQLARLLDLLPETAYCHASTFYWKAKFVPFPHINGRVGMKLSTLSKYKIADAARYRLAQYPWYYVWQHFMPKRAILETRLPVKDEPDMVVLNTHLEVFGLGTNVKQRQTEIVDALLNRQDGNAGFSAAILIYCLLPFRLIHSPHLTNQFIRLRGNYNNSLTSIRRFPVWKTFRGQICSTGTLIFPTITAWQSLTRP